MEVVQGTVISNESRTPTWESINGYINRMVNTSRGEEASNYFDTSLVLDAVAQFGERITWRPGIVNELRREWERERFEFDREDDYEGDDVWD